MADRNYEHDARVLRALANESRLRIVERLATGQACVCELTEMLGLDQSTVSKHLTVLKTADVIRGARRGNHIYYRLLAPCVLGFLDCAASVRACRESVEPSDECGPVGTGADTSRATAL